jgi:SulP family sulfate permease
MGLYLGQPRSAAVVTEENCVVYGLTAQALTRMERNDPAAAAAFHRFMACLLAERLANTNQTLRAVLD